MNVTFPLPPTALLLATLVALGGCATVPPISGPTLSVAEARTAASVDSTDGTSSNETFADAPRVRWGGTIADVRNTADGTTVLEIVSRPLRRGGRPRGGDATDGRFLAEVDAFLDPAIVQAGRDMTVTGRVAGGRDGRIGETVYRFPVVAVEDYRYWRPEPPPTHFPHPMPVSDFHADLFHGWPHATHHHRQRRSLVGGASVSGVVSF